MHTPPLGATRPLQAGLRRSRAPPSQQAATEITITPYVSSTEWRGRLTGILSSSPAASPPPADAAAGTTTAGVPATALSGTLSQVRATGGR